MKSLAMLLKNVSSKYYCIFSLFLLFTIYNLTVSPTIYWRDSPEFIDTAYTLGIAHPAGFPTYTIISKIFTFLPFSNIAMRVNYVSLFFSVLTCWITFYIIIELINICFKEASNYGASLAGMFGVLILSSASSYWWMSTVTEVYTINCFFLSAFFLSALKWYQSKELKYLIFASFIFGLSIGVYGANLLFLPAILIFYFLVEGKQKPNNLLFAATFFIFAYSIHFFLPIRSLTNPPFDWGNTETIHKFIFHITDRKDDVVHFHNLKYLSILFKTFAKFIGTTLTELTLVGFIFTVAGIICHFKKDKKSFFLLVSFALIYTIFFLTTIEHEAQDGSRFLISFLVFDYWIGFGIYALIATSNGYILSFKYKNIIIPVIISFIAFSFIKDYQSNNKAYYYLPRDHSREMHIDMAQNGVVVASYYWLLFRYFQDVENLRPDVSIILISDLTSPETFNKVTKERFPLLNIPDTETKRENQHEFIQLLISKNINDKPIYWDFKRDLTKYNYPYLIPENKFLMRFSKQKTDIIPDSILESYFLKLKDSMTAELDDEQFFLDQDRGVRTYYTDFLMSFSDYLMKRGMYKRTIPFLKLAKTISFSWNIEALILKEGICYLNIGDYEKAENIFMNFYRKTKGYVDSYNLALLYYKKGELNKSKGYLNETLKINNDYINGHFLQGLIFAKEGNHDKAIKKITYAIEKTNYIPKKKKMQAALEEVKRLKAESYIGTGSVQISTESNKNL